jgi:hypothetical protein
MLFSQGLVIPVDISLLRDLVIDWIKEKKRESLYIRRC